MFIGLQIVLELLVILISWDTDLNNCFQLNIQLLSTFNDSKQNHYQTKSLLLNTYELSLSDIVDNSTNIW